MNIGFFLKSFNIVFLLPIGLATLFIALQAVGLGLTSFDGDLDLDADLDADIDADVDLDVDVDADLDVDLDADAEVSVDAGVEAGEASMLLHFLSWFHLGKVPMSVLLSVFFYAFGFAGLLATTNLRQSANIHEFGKLTMIAVPIALVAGLLFTKLLGGVVGRILPGVETKRSGARMWVGLTAEVVSTQVDSEKGRGLLEDEDGDLHTVFLQLMNASAEPIPKGQRVKLLRYKAQEGKYLCSLADEGLES